MKECKWPGDNPIMQQYHDEEWCVPSHEDTYIFEMLTLEGAQAGLSWSTILAKRDGYRQAFHHFDISACAGMADEELEEIQQTGNIIRNKLKIKSVRSNAKAILQIQKEHGSFSEYLWSFVDGKPIINSWSLENQVPTKDAVSEVISKHLKKKGFSFVGSVIIYSYMQAIGLVDDHIVTCPFHTKNRNVQEGSIQ